MLQQHIDVPWSIFENRSESNIQSTLYYASFSGLLLAVQGLVKTEVDVNMQGGTYGNALQAASYGGHEAIVGLLLEKGANVNAQGGECGNALCAASQRGHEAIVDLLLERGADVNTQGGKYGNALQAAIFINKTYNKLSYCKVYF